MGTEGRQEQQAGSRVDHPPPITSSPVLPGPDGPRALGPDAPDWARMGETSGVPGPRSGGRNGRRKGGTHSWLPKQSQVLVWQGSLRQPHLSEDTSTLSTTWGHLPQAFPPRALLVRPPPSPHPMQSQTLGFTSQQTAASAGTLQTCRRQKASEPGCRTCPEAQGASPALPSPIQGPPPTHPVPALGGRPTSTTRAELLPCPPCPSLSFLSPAVPRSPPSCFPRGPSPSCQPCPGPVPC